MNRGVGYRIVLGLLLLAAAVGIGAYTYNLGLARGLAQSGAVVGAAPVGPWAYGPWGYGPWGYGFFPFFHFFPLLFFILFWVFLSRALFWRGRRYGRYGGGCGETYPDRGGRTTHL
jgi:hypothetical protein